MSLVVEAGVEGMSALIEKLGKTQEDWKHAVAGAVFQKGLAVIADSVVEVPVDTGRLRQTAYVAPPTDIDDPVAEAGYGTNYAVPVHEIDIPHAVGKDQFLRDPFNQHMAGYVRWITDRAKKLFARGTRLGAIPSSVPRRPKGG